MNVYENIFKSNNVIIIKCNILLFSFTEIIIYSLLGKQKIIKQKYGKQNRYGLIPKSTLYKY